MQFDVHSYRVYCGSFNPEIGVNSMHSALKLKPCEVMVKEIREVIELLNAWMFHMRV